MRYFTKRAIPMNLWGASVVLPESTEVIKITGQGGGWAVKSQDMLVKLTSNTHDPKYRYAWVKDEDVAARPGMTLAQIKEAIDAGKPVRWSNEGYHVIRDKLGQYLIVFQPNQHTIGLTHQDGFTLNGKPEEFYING